MSSVDEQTIIRLLNEQPWHGASSREVVHASIIDETPLLTDPPCSVGIVEVRFEPGTHEIYQLLLGLRPAEEEEWSRTTVEEFGGSTVYEALADPVVPRELVHLMRAGASRPGLEGTIELRLVDGLPPPPDGQLEGFALGADQSNSSVVLDDALILKVYRRLEAGINPELELLRFLTVQGFANIAALRGWYEYGGRPLEATLGILQDYAVGSDDGWNLALGAVLSGTDEFVARVRRLGEVTGAMHAVLGSDSSDPNFAPEAPGADSLGLLVASANEQVERVFRDLPDGVDALAPIAGRGEEVSDLLRAISHGGSLGRRIRNHGDYHLGQVLWTGDDWLVLDFEGEPARSLAERRQKRSPLRDVAGMLRSFSYASSAAPMLLDVETPPGFEQRLRDAFLAGYIAEVDASLLPASEQAVERLLAMFELEKSVYELHYELNHRPDWVRIPVAGIERLLGTGVS